MNRHAMNIVAIAGALIGLLGSPAGAQPAAAPPAKKVLGVGAVKATPSLIDATNKAGKSIEMRRVIDAMDGQLMDRFQNTRKFTLVSRTGLSEILKEQKLVESGNIDTDDAAAAKAFKLAGCNYLIVTTVDSFQDYEEKVDLEAIGARAVTRVIQFSAVGRIYDTTTGRLLESANFQLDNKSLANNPVYIEAHGQLSDRLLTEIARTMSEQIAHRVIDVINPAQIIARTDNTVTINRGDGTGVAVGQMWEVFALGKELIDPDTGASLGKEEVKVGSVKITSVQPLFCKGEVQDDKGVDKGMIVRQVAAEKK